MHRSTAAAIALGLVCAGAAGGLSLGQGPAPDAVLAGAFEDALASTETTWSATAPNVWLSSLGMPAQSFGKTIAIGDMITIKGRTGAPEVIEVTGLEQVEGSGIGLAGVRFQLVTGRPAQQPEAGLVRFLFAGDAPETSRPAASSRSQQSGRAL
jgi:hypothetical protein